MSNTKKDKLPNPGAMPNAADLTKNSKMNPVSIVSSAEGQTPAIVAMNYLLFTLYSLVGTLIYYPSFIVNIPASTLEETLPKEDLCMRMGLSKRTCKKKIKCLFQKCDYLDDPIGYQLDKQYQRPCNRKRIRHENTEKSKPMFGGKSKTRKYHKSKNWRRQLSGKMKEQMKRDYENNILNLVLNKKQKRNKKTKKFYGGNEKNLLNHKTCKNKQTKILCSLRDGTVQYKELLPFSEILSNKKNILNMFGGHSKDNSDKPSEETFDETTKQNAEEKIKGIILTLIKEHNEKLHTIIEENPEHAPKVIEDVKKKSKLLRFFLEKYPNTIEKYLTKYSDKLVPFIKGIQIETLTQQQLENTETPKNAENTETPQHVEDKQFIEEAEQRKILIRSFFVEKVKTQTLFKLAIVLQAMKQLFKDENISDAEKNDIKPPPEKQTTSVVFPWNFNDPNMRLTDRIKCLNSHITQTKFEREKDPELYDKCFICKHCTLRNTASKVWGGVIKELLAGNKSKQFVELINNTYGMLREHIEFPFMTDKQYYLTTLISLQLVNHNFEIDKVDTRFNVHGADFELKDLVVGIPPVSIVGKERLRDHFDELRKCYIAFHQIGIAQEIHGIYYESLMRKYFQIQPEHREEKLHFLKSVAFKNYELLYVKNQRSKIKSQGVYEKLYDNDINKDEMEYFSHFEKNAKLENLKNSENYTDLNQYLEYHLRSQYYFLLNKNNFTPDYLNRSHSHQGRDGALLKKITMKLF